MMGLNSCDPGILVIVQVDGLPVTVGIGNIISEEGFSLLMSPAAAPSVWKAILSQGAIPMGSIAWEKLRVMRGIKFFRLCVYFHGIYLVVVVFSLS